jgi:hypothetical protein
MPEFKRHHFVPQFYLRNFASDPRQRQIGLFEIHRGLFVPNASIRSQAQRNRLYGPSSTEKALGDLEGLAAGVIRGAVERRELPRRFTDGHAALLMFVLFQAFRTPAAGAAMEEAGNQLMKTIMANDPKVAPYLDGIRLVLSDPVLRSLQTAVQHHHFVVDLCYKLLINRTDTPFITSDHPVVLYNQFMERRRAFGSNTGLGCKGLQMFLPLSPHCCLILYDCDVYKVGGRSLKSVQVAASLDDVKTLNTLQAANADNQLFFNHQTREGELRRVVAHAQSFRPATRYTAKEYPGRQLEGGFRSSIVVSSKVDILANLALSNVKELPSAQTYKLGNRAAHPRNPALLQLHDEFTDRVKANEYRLNEWGKFLADKEGGLLTPRSIVEYM